MEGRREWQRELEEAGWCIDASGKKIEKDRGGVDEL